MRKLAGLLFCVSILPLVRAKGQIQNGPQNPTIAPNQASKPASDAPAYTAESIVFEQLNTVYRYAADGTGTKEFSVVERIQSDAAARQSGVVNFPFASSTERVEIEYLRVRKPDGSVVETPAADAQEMTLEVTRQAPFYSDLKEKQIPVRNLRIGDKLEYKAKIVRTKAETPGDFWGQENFGSGVIVLNETIELHLPKNKYVKVWSPEHQPVVSEAGDEKIYRWTGSQLKPTILSLDDKKKASDEAAKKQINPEGELPAIAWTTFKTWEDVGAWYRGLEGDRMAPNADVKAKTAEVIAGKTTDDEKIRAIYAYVATQIRYIGVALGIGRYQPHPAAEVLANQYGDCKDKHTLLAAMLTAAGFHPQAALIGAGIRINPDVPSPSAFNHLITALPLDGKLTWLDSTAEIAPYHMLVITIRDKQALVVPDIGVAALQRTPASLPFAPIDTFVAKGTLGKDGTVKAHMEYVTRGDSELVLRTIFRQVPPGQWEQLVQNISNGLGYSGATSHAETGRPDVTAEPFKLNYDYEKEKLGDWDNLRIVPLLPAVFLPILDEKDPPTWPIDLGDPQTTSAKSVLTLPDGWGVVPPSDVHQKTTYITFDKTYKIEGETLTVERKIEVLQRRIPVAQWKAYKKWTDATVSEGEPWIQLIKPGDSKLVTVDVKAGDSSTSGAAPATEEPKDKKAQIDKLMAEAYADMQRGEVNKAQATLDQVKSIDDKRPGLWAMYGYVHGAQSKWPEVIDDLKKELIYNPSNYQVYISLAAAQLNSGKVDDAANSLRTLMKNDPQGNNMRGMLPMMLEQAALWDELVAVLKDQAKDSPDDAALQIRLGTAQMKAGKIDDGLTTLRDALKSSSDARVLNDGSYALANAGVDLSLDEAYARKAVEIITAKSADWNEKTVSPEQAKDQRLLVASWDTLGWILFKESHADDAEGYLQAAWRNWPQAETGLHLGQLKEKAAHPEEALAIYDMANSQLTPAQRNAPANHPDPVADGLHKHIAALQQKGIKLKAPDVRDSLQKLRMLPVGKRTGNNLLIFYTVILSDGKVVEVQASGKNVADANDSTDSLVRKADFSAWTPPHSTARLVREGTLNCHTGVCEFVVNPF